MTPSSTPNHVRNSFYRDAIFSGQHSECDDIGRVFPANLDNLSFGELCMAMFTPAIIALLFGHICHVFGMSAKEKMRDSHTGSVIAMVTHLHTFRYRAVFQFPSEAVSKYQLSALVRSNLPMPADFHAEASPLPTAVRSILVNLCPKTLYDITAAIVAVNKLARLPFNPSSLLVGMWRKLGQLPATAMAVTVWDFVRGIIEGHSDLHSRCVKPWGVSRTAGALLFRSYISIIPQNSRFTLVGEAQLCLRF